jgi:hypothetical protein
MAARQPHNVLGQLQHVDLSVGVADVDRVRLVGVQQAVDALDKVGVVLEGARLGAPAIDGQRLVGQGLIDEVGHDTAVVQAHARAIGIEDAHDARLQAVVAVVGHRHCLGKALGLVVDAARADGVDVAPVALRLRVHLRVAVDLRGGGEEVARTLVLGQTQCVVGSQRADLERRDGMLQVVVGAGRGSEVQHGVERAIDVDVLADVVLDEAKALMPKQVGDVVHVASNEVVHADDGVTFGNEPVAQVRPQEAGGAGDEYTHDPLQ